MRMLRLMTSEDNHQALNTYMKLISVATFKVATVFVVLHLYGCGSSPVERIHSGEAQGTTYMIKYN